VDGPAHDEVGPRPLPNPRARTHARADVWTGPRHASRPRGWCTTTIRSWAESAPAKVGPHVRLAARRSRHACNARVAWR
jgi:hypothetical protein